MHLGFHKYLLKPSTIKEASPTSLDNDVYEMEAIIEMNKP